MRLLWTLLTFCAGLNTILATNNDLIDYVALFGDSPRRDLNFTALVSYDGYRSESHSVTTEDGYILGVYRIPPNGSCPEDPDKQPIIFMHGLYLSGDDCIIPGPGKAHCYIYADNCYDVWVPNVRGNRYSRRHQTLDPDKDTKFWDFSVDEMALKDLPATIDYILKETNKTQISYVAHSQGVAMLLILCAKQPEYNDKIKIGFGLSATAWLSNARFVVIPIQAALSKFTAGLGSLTNSEIVPHGGLTQTAGEYLCGISSLSYPACSVFVFAVLGYNRFQIRPNVLPVITGHTPSGTSFKDFLRWGQMRRNGFSKYDYGIAKNLRVYGQTKPPLFNLQPVTMPWIFYTSYNDYVGDVRDIKTLTDALPNANMCILNDKTFGHLDFIYADNLAKYITPNVLSYLSNSTYTCN